MKATGVVRRIDELGRIVIPKEIRKTLRIKEGESLEIYIDSNEFIILKKYSSLNKISDFATIMVDSIEKEAKHNIIITDTDSIIATTKNLKKKYLNKNISTKILEMIKKREKTNQNIKKLEIVEGLEEEYSYIFNPIIANGDVLGSVILLKEEENITENDVKLINITTQILSKYLEE